MAVPNPINRKEKYLYKIATGGGEIPARPLSREEQYLEAIAMGGGGGGAVKSVNSKTGDVVLDATDIKLTTNKQTIQQNFIRIDGELERKTEVYWVDKGEPDVEEIESHRSNGDIILMHDSYNDIYMFAEGSLGNGIFHFVRFTYMNESKCTINHQEYIKDTESDSWAWYSYDIPVLVASEEYGIIAYENLLQGLPFSAEEFDNAPDEAIVCKETFNNVLNPTFDEIYIELGNKIPSDQGIDNANKVLCTNGDGVVFPLISTSEVMRASDFTIDENGRVWFGEHRTRIHNFFSPYDQRPGIKYSFNFSVIINGQAGDYGGSDGISSRTADQNTDITVRSSWMGWANGYVNKIGYVIDKGTSNQKIVWKILNPPVTEDEGIKAQAGSLAVAFAFSIPASELPKGTHDLSFCALVNDETYEIGTRTAQYGGGCFSITITNT